MGGKSGYGTILAKGAVEIAQLTNIGGLDLKADSIDISTHSSADGFREYIPGMKDGGEVPIEGLFDPSDAGQVAAITDIGAGTSAAYTITFPEGSSIAFTGFLIGVKSGAPYDDKMSFSGTLKISGKPIFTGGTTLYSATFTVTAAAGGTAISGATIVFHNQTKTTDAAGQAVFIGLPAGTYVYGVDKDSYVGESDAVVVTNANITPAVTLALE